MNRTLINYILACIILTIGAMALQSTAKASNDSLDNYLELLDKLDTGKPADDIEHIKYLAKYPFQETVIAVLDRLEMELLYAEEGSDYNIEVIEESLNTLIAVANKDSIGILHQMLRLAQVAFKNSQAELNAISESFTLTAKRLRTKREELETVEEALPELKEIRESREKGIVPAQGTTKPRTYARKYELSPKEWVADVETGMAKKVVGQKEAQQRFLDIELSDSIKGQRKKPKVVVLMGAPGTGKDTIVEGYTDGIHGYEEAHLEHMYRLRIVKSDADLWQVYGSATGYVGSDQLPTFLKFIIQHSGGKYLLQENRSPMGIEYHVEENPAWEGKSLPGYYPPESAVVFANEFHNWSKFGKDEVLKQALEKGYFPINNPNGGLSEIYVPVTFVIGTNEGLELVTSREANGERFGKPLTYEQTHEKYEHFRHDTEALKKALTKSNGLANQTGGKESLGISEEFMNRIPENAYVLMEPQSPQELQEIAEIVLKDLAKEFKGEGGKFGSFEITWDRGLPEFIQEYRYEAENNGRPIAQKVENLIEKTFFEAFKQELVQNSDETRQLHFRIKAREEFGFDLVMDLETAGKKETIHLPIEATLRDKPIAPLSNSEIDRLIDLDVQMKSNLFGIDHVIERLAKAELEGAEGRNGITNTTDATHEARTYMFLGPSSTGKTETAKVLAEARTGSRDNLVTIDFSQVATKEDLKVKILGTRDHNGNSIASDFMKHYDRNQGKLVFVFDEIANAPLETLKALYDILREPVVTTFSDGEARIMSNVTLILTGNAGEEWYKDIPRHTSEEMQMRSMLEIYEKMMSNPAIRRATLEKYFSEAFINRIGERRIFFFPPLVYKAIRQLVQLKLNQAINELKPKKSSRGWEISFPSKEVYSELVEAFEAEAFIVREQGASLDRFLKQDFAAELRVLLLKNKVPSGSKILVGLAKENGYVKEAGKVTKIRLSIFSENSKTPLEMVIDGKKTPYELEKPSVDEILTAYHEAGHEIVRKYYFPKEFKSQGISNIPGIAMIAGRFIPYEGIAQHTAIVDVVDNREVVLREMATLFGGEVAQTLVTKGARNDAGKSNDMERASLMARTMILKKGLSKAWGLDTIPQDMDFNVYIQSLSEDRKQVLNQEVNKVLEEARALAKKALLDNHQAFAKMGMQLALTADMTAEDLTKFYEQNPLYTEKNPAGLIQKFNPSRLKAQFSGLVSGKTRDAQLMNWVPVPEEMPDIDKIILEERAKSVATISVPENAPIVVPESGFESALKYFGTASKGSSKNCETLLLPREDS